MANLRIFWIIWCCGWAFFWFLAGFGTFLLGWLMVPVSLALILVPVGAGQGGSKAILPPCLSCGAPAESHADGKCPEQQRQVGH
jgi:hypothetical protein